MAEHLSSEQKVAGSSPVWSRVCAVVVIRRFRVRIPGGIELCPVGPTVRRLTTEVLPMKNPFLSYLKARPGKSYSHNFFLSWIFRGAKLPIGSKIVVDS